MTIVKRLRLLTAILGLAAVSAVVGTSVFGDIRIGGLRPNPTNGLQRAEPARVAEDIGWTKFSDLPAITYKHQNNATAFAWQVKPALPAVTARDRDILVMVDTSASQAGAPLQRARFIIDSLAHMTAAGDRISIWTANLDDDKVTRSLTGGFQPAQSDAVRTAASALVELEYPAGATDLHAALEKASATFEPNPGRQQVILFLGDGESAASPAPLDEVTRIALGHKLEQQGLSFFAVPLGLKVNSHNLHGFSTLTGGTVLRITQDVTSGKGRRDAAEQIKAALDVPVFKVNQVTYGNEVADAFPTRLPPIRGDKATLVVGTLAQDSPSVTAKLTGHLTDGRPFSIDLAERLPVSEPDNYFLHAMLEQWRSAPDKAAPAILAADRALALGSQQFRLFREEFLTQAVYAVSSVKLDHAEKLYQAALKIDPSNAEAETGLAVVRKMKSGELTHDKLRNEVKNFDKLRTALVAKKIGAINLQEANQPVDPVAQGGANRLSQAQAERQVQEQQYRVLVDDTIRRARQLLSSDPDTAYEDLKRQRDIVLSNPTLSDAFRARLVSDLEQMMQTVNTQGAVIKRNLAAERERIARTRLSINEFERNQTLEEQTRARFEAFKQLMNQARFELAQQEAQILIQEQISRGGRFDPAPEAIAAYMIGQSATNLREHRELVRIREDRYLLTMMQVEKSFIPYPDEPPVHFPPAAVWRELTSARVEKYSSASLGSDVPATMRRIQSIIDGPTAQRVRIEAELDTLPLRDIVQQLEKEHDLKIIVLEEAFRAQGEQAILDKKPTIKQRLTGLTVGAFLDIVLLSMNATYVVRPEYIEITTIEKRLEEKVVQAFDVAELVQMVPSSVNQSTLYQNLQLQGANLALFGQATFAGGFGAIGGLGLGGFGALGAGGLGLGGGGLGGGLGGAGLGGGGGNAIGGGLGAVGQGNNLGVGGGVAGFGGGQLGQFGNLGGQFGIQGNDASPFLLTLITEVVARGEWSSVNDQFQFNPGDPNAGFDDEPKILEEKLLNSLGYYPPARALVVRGTGKYHAQSSIKLKAADAFAAGGGGNPKRFPVAQAPNAGNAPANQVAADDKPKLNNPHENVREVLKNVDRGNPMRMWQQAIDQGKIKDPGLVIACADFLFEGDQPKAKQHAAEILKAGIRRGLTNDVWAHEALALALKESQASPFEVKRAAMSVIDLEPEDAKGYIKAAQAADDNGQLDLALAFCKRAANLQPNMPLAYANALAYAEKAPEARSDAILWASDNLLRRDWTSDTVDYHASTKARLTRIVNDFEEKGQVNAIEQVKKALELEKQRDLVIELLWQGTADLDLNVSEPSGSTATPTNKRTPGGGVLKCDVMEQGTDNRSETYTAAQALSGTYTITAKTALGKAIGDRATIKVTKFAGTDREEFEIHSINLKNQEQVVIHLDGGTRNELATLPTQETQTWQSSEPKVASTQRAPRGFSAGTGTATGILTSSADSQMQNHLPAVIQPLETKIPGIARNSAQMRAVANVSPDRKHVTIQANPVFPSIAADVPMPKVSLLPGASGN